MLAAGAMLQGLQLGDHQQSEFSFAHNGKDQDLAGTDRSKQNKEFTSVPLLGDDSHDMRIEKDMNKKSKK